MLFYSFFFFFSSTYFGAVLYCLPWRSFSQLRRGFFAYSRPCRKFPLRVSWVVFGKVGALQSSPFYTFSETIRYYNFLHTCDAATRRPKMPSFTRIREALTASLLISTKMKQWRSQVGQFTLPASFLQTPVHTDSLSHPHIICFVICRASWSHISVSKQRS